MLSDLALVGHVQIEELSAGVRHAADLGYAKIKSCLVTAVIVADQLALPGAEEGTCMFPGTAGCKVVDDCP